MSEHRDIPPKRVRKTDGIIDQLQAEIRKAVSHDPPLPVNLGRYRHGWLVRGLHGLVYGQSSSPRTRKEVRTTFTDGSETRPFPIDCLPPPPPLDPKAYPLRVGLNSGRHPDMDQDVSLYLIRNHEVQQWETSAEQEEETFLRSMDFFQDPCWKEGGVIEMYHTGLEPLVLGFYRAVVEVACLRHQQDLPRLQVVPKIFVSAKIRVKNFLRFALSLERNRLEVIVERTERWLRQVTEELDLFFALRAESDELILDWLPKRPMWETERDYLLQRFPSIQGILLELYGRSQYQTEKHWG